ncbi:MAG: YifB family Mg chelatase-like AAA ATPase [Rhizobiales bacterium]|nr:YifB family Mg chelatase-like AAA ATPase [Hyphomicrobiales bacterium]
MVARVSTVSFQGIDAVPVDVQVLLAPGLPKFIIVGLPDKAVAESSERVRAALHASGLSLPPKRITINLAPADLPKEGSHYDLPIALGLMAALNALPGDLLSRYLVMGELSLDGRIEAVTGALPAAIAASQMNKGLICPESCGREAAWAGEDVDILAPSSLLQLANHFKGTQILSNPVPALQEAPLDLPDLSDIKGQESARRALEVAAAGGHNMLMIGPPGSGKSMLAARLPSILPPLSPRELLEVSMIGSIAGTLPQGGLSRQRPFRSPHHSASMPAMVGGGVKAKPGEVSLAHNGVLFLDEFPEFPPQVLDSLRQPLESGETSIARVNYRLTYPSRFQLIAAMNPCRCGNAATPGYKCARGARCVTDYQARISGPLLDRIDIRIAVPALMASDLISPKPSEASKDVALRVKSVRDLQQARFADMGFPDIRFLAEAPTDVVDKIAEPDAPGKTLLSDAADTLKLSARGYHRVLKLARTLADLDGARQPGRIHLAEALSYRMSSSLPGSKPQARNSLKSLSM